MLESFSSRIIGKILFLNAKSQSGMKIKIAILIFVLAFHIAEGFCQDNIFPLPSGPVGIGTTNPGFKLEVVKDGGAGTIALTSYRNEAGQSAWLSRFARGSLASPAIVQNGDLIGAFDFYPYNGTNFNLQTAIIYTKVSGIVSESSIPTDIVFGTDATGTAYGSGKERLVIKSTGNIGIGTTSPVHALEVNGNVGITTGNNFIFSNNIGTNRSISFKNPSGNDNLASIAGYPSSGTDVGTAIQAIPRGSGYNSSIRAQFTAFNTDYVADPSNYEAVVLRAGGEDFQLFTTRYGTGVAKPLWLNATGNATAATSNLYLTTDGNVGIGTINPQAKLAVKGNVFAEKIKVTLSPTDWPDYVFHKSYPLLPLHELEKFIQQNTHLPDVPSVAEVQRNGLDLGDNQATLLKKVEELTLYVIEMNKTIERQDKQVKQLQSEVNQLQKKNIKSNLSN